MRAVFKHEVSSYFTNLSGYVFGAFLLLFAGIYTMVYNLNNALAAFEYVIGNMSFVFLIIIPILTMRCFAEERRQKTDQLLYSLPLSVTQVVLGKFAALLVVFFVPVAVISLYPLVLSAYGSVNMLGAYGGMAGFFLLGAALMSIGMYISSVTESQAVAAGLCFVVMLVNYFIADLASFVPTSAFASLAAFMVLILVGCGVLYLMTKNGFLSLMCAAVLEAAMVVAYTVKSSVFENLFPTFMEKLSLYERFYTMINGVFDLRSVVYFISVIAVFLFLCVQSLEKRRWSE